MDAATAQDQATAQKQTVDQMTMQWRGGRNDGVDFGTDLAREVRDILRKKPERVDEVAAANLEFCQEWADGGVATMSWGGWLQALPDELTQGDCIAMVEVPWFEVLTVDRAWQHDVELCPDEQVELSASARSEFSLGPDGPVSTVSGVVEPSPPEDALCREEGCLWGALLGRFEGEDGQITVFVIGAGTVFTAPSEGILSFAINDGEHRDNFWSVEDGVQDGASIGVRPTR
jgi:hypothetical protein